MKKVTYAQEILSDSIFFIKNLPLQHTRVNRVPKEVL